MRIGKGIRKIGGGARGARSVARATEPFDPDAIDGDDDGLVQEGTAFERTATPKVPEQAVPSAPPKARPKVSERTTPQKGPKVVPRKGPYSDYPTRSRRTAQRLKPDTTIADEAVGDPRPWGIAEGLGPRVPMQRRMTKEEIAEVRPRLVGLNISATQKQDRKAHPRRYFASGFKQPDIFENVSFKDSILNTFSNRVREIVDGRSDLNYKELVEKYGPLETVEDLAAALQKAYPNTPGGAILIAFPLDQKMFSGRLDTPMKAEMLFDEIDPSMAMVRYQMLKMLQWGNENPRTASQITNLSIGAQKQGSKHLGSMGQSPASGLTRAVGVSDDGIEQFGYQWARGFSMNPQSDVILYSVESNLEKILKSYSLQTMDKPDASGRQWNVNAMHVASPDGPSIDGLLNSIQATHEHEFGHVIWYNAMARAIGGETESWGIFGESQATASTAIAAAREKYSRLGIDDPDELIRQITISTWREIARSVSDLIARGEYQPRNEWNVLKWLEDAQRLEDATDPDEIKQLTSEALNRISDFGLQPGSILFGTTVGRGMYSRPTKARPNYLPRDTRSLQASDNPFNMPAFMLYRVFEKADIDISLAETKTLLKEAMRFISERSQYGSVSVSEAFAELYSYKMLGYLTESDGAPWRLMQLLEQSMVAMGGKSLFAFDRLDVKSLRRIQNLKKIRKARRIVEPFDANAVDADNDGIVQDGTIHERPNLAVGANAIADQVRKSQPVKKKKKKPKAPKVDQAIPVRPITERKPTEPTELVDKRRLRRRVNDQTRAIEFGEDLSSDEKQSILQKLRSMSFGAGTSTTSIWRRESGNDRAEASGIIEINELADSPFSTFSSRVIKIHKEKASVDMDSLEKRFGKIQTMDDLHKALSEALPNLKELEFRLLFSENQLLGIDEDSATGRAIQNEVIDEIDTQMLAAYTLSMSLLEWAIENPESAKIVEKLELGTTDKPTLRNPLTSETISGSFGLKVLNLRQHMTVFAANNAEARTAKTGISWRAIHEIKKRTTTKERDKAPAEALIKSAELLVDHESFHIAHDLLIYRMFGEYPTTIMDAAGAYSTTDANKIKTEYINLLRNAGVEEPESVYNFSLASSAIDIAKTIKSRTGMMPESIKRNARNTAQRIDDLGSRLLGSNSISEQNQIANELVQVLIENNIFFPTVIVGPLRGDMPLSFVTGLNMLGQVRDIDKFEGLNLTQEQKMSGSIFAIPIKKMLEKSNLDPDRVDELIQAASAWMAQSGTLYGNTMWAELIAELYTAKRAGILTERDGDAYLLIDYILQALESTGGKSLETFISGLKIKVTENG